MHHCAIAEIGMTIRIRRSRECKVILPFAIGYCQEVHHLEIAYGDGVAVGAIFVRQRVLLVAGNHDEVVVQELHEASCVLNHRAICSRDVHIVFLSLHGGSKKKHGCGSQQNGNTFHRSVSSIR